MEQKVSIYRTREKYRQVASWYRYRTGIKNEYHQRAESIDTLYSVDIDRQILLLLTLSTSIYFHIGHFEM